MSQGVTGSHRASQGVNALFFKRPLLQADSVKLETAAKLFIVGGVLAVAAVVLKEQIGVKL